MKSAKIKIYLDTDIVISSLLSKTGGAHLIINFASKHCCYVSNIQETEIKQVAKRLGISPDSCLETLQKLQIVKQAVPIGHYIGYVSDPNDAHTVAGAVKSQAKFLITYNLKHYKSVKLKENLDLETQSPGQFLQYLRSQ